MMWNLQQICPQGPRISFNKRSFHACANVASEQNARVSVFYANDDAVVVAPAFRRRAIGPQDLHPYASDFHGRRVAADHRQGGADTLRLGEQPSKRRARFTITVDPDLHWAHGPDDSWQPTQMVVVGM